MQVFLCVVLFIFQFQSSLSDDVSSEQTLLERSLIKENPEPKEILDNYQKYVLLTNRVENGVLGFISNNEDSYLNGTVYAKKFSYLSPFWFNIERTNINQYRITGHKNIDRKWIKELIEKNSNIRIVPRMTFNGWKPTDFLMLASSELEFVNLSTELVNFCDAHHIHGLILDLFDNWYGKMPDSLLTEALQDISARLRMNFYVSLLMVPPKYVNVQYLNKGMFENIAEYVSGVALMTLNSYSIKSIENYIKQVAPKENYRKKILFTIEFDGFATSSVGHQRKITKKEYLEYLRKYNNKLHYDENKVENYFEITIPSGETLTIFYPTLQYVYERINLANNLRTGISVWNVGDGLDYFYELL